MKPLTATLRLQFHSDFTLDHAVPLVPYFAQLGISHLYASPILKARAARAMATTWSILPASTRSWAARPRWSAWLPPCASMAWG